ncbi:cysteine-rich receptor-like protein kinase 15 [Selaginella moellendorffii]|uniref:cysteine-rich receptor-like protein kinase 15 n=1 Tax=Selaginella moellendorffii TaxID=88036 RepID=UPI000D1C78D6|nr:cysteine-rich receptor-like protein kinase 15 [Selaginella moellendorffii]|eukprot:XP_024517171.1 cysteine-rich receptor-like protein kinase 15 [Selaginella moellendorffii]
MANHPLPLVLVASVFIAAFALASNSTTDIDIARPSCSDAYKITSAQMGRNLLTVLATLQDQGPAAGGYKSTSFGSMSDTVYGFIQCRGDISAQECSSCARSAVQILNSTCVRNSTKGGRIHPGNCFLRYEDHFFSSILDKDTNQGNCSTSIPASSLAIFQSNSRTALEFLKAKVPRNARKFVAAVAGIGSAVPAYALGQCIPDLSAADCASCLAAAENAIASTCRGGGGGVCYYSSCTLFFQRSKFFQGIPENATVLGNGTLPSNSKAKKTLLLAIAIPIAGVLALLLLVIGFFISKRSKNVSKPPEELDELQVTLHRGPVTFSYDLLRRATEGFSDDHKLGEGGFGAVYKGTFSDGTEIAIKKLSVASKQWEQQFLNEVKVIGSVQHRNLVRLLGCCVEGSERLLVYEFLKNNSLEKALLDDLISAEETPRLGWNTRYNILLGTARGLTYLHEDSQIRIVHRDIKPSNILLDETFEAKISDFGLARLYGEDEATEIITTKVAGTYGYMAPEYAFHGHLSEKADVFSFGVVVLETLAGRKNKDASLPEPEQYLLEWAWQLHSNRLLPNLLHRKLVSSSNNEQEKTLVQAIHIALMCTQASPQDRPSMSHVVAMLSGHSNVNVPLSATFDIRAMNPRFYSSSSNSAASDPKNKRQEKSQTFTDPEPR